MGELVGVLVGVLVDVLVSAMTHSSMMHRDTKNFQCASRNCVNHVMDLRTERNRTAHKIYRAPPEWERFRSNPHSEFNGSTTITLEQ